MRELDLEPFTSVSGPVGRHCCHSMHIPAAGVVRVVVAAPETVLRS